MNKPVFKLLLLAIPVFLIALAIVIPTFIWTFCRIEVEPGKMAVLTGKTGKTPAPGAVISQPGEKGVQLKVLSEGRYFYNPYDWSWEYEPIQDIQPGNLGVVWRNYGSDLPFGEILAKEGTKGLISDVLTPGKYRYNPRGYTIQQFPATTINPGECGVVLSLVGADPLSGGKLEKANTFTVVPGEKGVEVKTLDPGTYYLNPYICSVIPVNLQSSRFELAGDDAIDFLTMDGFPVRVEGTVEYALKRDKAPLLTHEVGDLDDILRKIILPRARGFARIEGSKGNALDYIVGETRQEFQNKLVQNLREGCGHWGVEIRSVLIRNITPPEEISSIIRNRELAKQSATMFVQQIVQAKSSAELEKQSMLAVQNKEKVNAETEKLKSVIGAKQKAQVRLTAAQQELSVAILDKAAAKEQAAGVVAKATGEATVINASNVAEADVLKQNADAFGSGASYSDNLMRQNISSKVRDVLVDDDANGIGGIFLKAINEGHSVPAGAN